MVAAVGAPVVLLADAASFALSFLVVLACVPPARGAEDGGEAPMAGGWRFIRGHAWLRPLTAAQALSQAAYMGMTAAIPVLAFSRYGRDAHLAGALLGAWGGGAMAGALLALGLVGRTDPRRLAAGAWLMQAAPLWALVATPPVGAAAAALAASGLANGIRNPPVFGLTAEYVPPRTLAETMTAASSIVMGGGFIALLVAGPALDLLDVAVVWGGIALTQTSAALVFARASWRERLATPRRAA
jgi:fucose permease